MYLYIFLILLCILLEHVWQVTMQKKGLGERKNINGPYRLCLTDRTLSLVKIGAQGNSDSIEFSVSLSRLFSRYTKYFIFISYYNCNLDFFRIPMKSLNRLII